MNGCSLSIRRERLARCLTRRAVLGLGVLTLLLIALAAVTAGTLWLACSAAWDQRWLTALGWLAIAVPCAAGGLRLARCLFAANPPPVGVPLSRELAPSLHALIERVGADFGELRIHTLWITGDINAAVLQRPRSGLCGRMENHLLIGLPLAHSVSERQLGAILAHEFGHLHRQRRALAAWGCHLRAWWFRAVDNCILCCPLLGWLLDHLTLADVARAQALSRMEEFEADHEAARVVGSPLLAQTLLELAARERFLRCDYWVKVMAQRSRLPRPNVRPYRDMGLGMVAGFLPALDRGECTGEDCGDEDGLHPSLSERLAALREAPALDTRVEDSVAERHLAPLLPRLAWELDRAWWSAARGEWREVYRSVQRRRSGSVA